LAVSRSTTSWSRLGEHLDRALYELLTIDVYDLLGLEVDAYDTAPCPAAVPRALRRPVQRSCSGKPPRRSAPALEPWGSPHRSDTSLAPSPCPILREDRG
jgi:hypothetical protein